MNVPAFNELILQREEKTCKDMTQSIRCNGGHFDRFW